MDALEALKIAEENIQQVSVPLNAHVQIQRIFANIKAQIEAENKSDDEEKKKSG